MDTARFLEAVRLQQSPDVSSDVRNASLAHLQSIESRPDAWQFLLNCFFGSDDSSVRFCSLSLLLDVLFCRGNATNRPEIPKDALCSSFKTLVSAPQKLYSDSFDYSSLFTTHQIINRSFTQSLFV